MVGTGTPPEIQLVSRIEDSRAGLNIRLNKRHLDSGKIKFTEMGRIGMRAKDLSIPKLVSDMLIFDNEEGKMLLNDRRSILIGADSIGTLQKDLIAILGYERAKGFLLRYGWNCGTNDAGYIKEMFPWEEELEWLLAAPKIHSIEGTVQVVPIEIRADRESGEFYSEGYWYHSYEAEQHIKHFGFHHEPVCATLVGYAGGYATQYMGQKIIFKEIECVGKGDPFCRYIGKPIENWGTEIKSVLPLYEEENLSNELENAYRRIESQKEILKKVLNINEKLSKVLIQGGGLSAVVRKLAETINTAVVLEDKHFNVMESSGEPMHYAMNKFIEHSRRKKDPCIRRLFVEKRTVELSLPETFGRQHFRLVSPILMKNEVWGYLSFVKEKGHFNEMEISALERAVNICTIQLLHERSVIETEQRMKGEFINELLLEHSNKENLSYQLRLMGYDLENPYYVFIFKVQQAVPSQHQPEIKSHELMQGLANSLSERIKSYGGKCLVSASINQIIAVIPEQLIRKTSLKPKSFGELLLNLINTDLDFDHFQFILGISERSQGLEKFREKYKEASKAIEIASLSKVENNVIFFEELGFLGILLHAKDGRQLERFAMDLLKDLVVYDKEHKAELLKTLYTFLENKGSIYHTAKEMMISVGGLRYRLKRIKEIGGIDVTKEKGLFDLHLALKILLFYGFFED